MIRSKPLTNDSQLLPLLFSLSCHPRLGRYSGWMDAGISRTVRPYLTATHEEALPLVAPDAHSRDKKLSGIVVQAKASPPDALSASAVPFISLIGVPVKLRNDGIKNREWFANADAPDATEKGFGKEGSEGPFSAPPTIILNVLGGNYALFFRRANPANPTRPAPNRYTAAGTGTGLNSPFTDMRINIPRAARSWAYSEGYDVPLQETGLL